MNYKMNHCVTSASIYLNENFSSRKVRQILKHCPVQIVKTALNRYDSLTKAHRDLIIASHFLGMYKVFLFLIWMLASKIFFFYKLSLVRVQQYKLCPLQRDKEIKNLSSNSCRKAHSLVCEWLGYLSIKWTSFIQKMILKNSQFG